MGANIHRGPAGVVNEDGSTDGGCRDVPIITTGATSSEGCPTGKWWGDEKLALALLVVLVVAGVLHLCGCAAGLVRYFCKKRPKPTRDNLVTPASYPNDHNVPAARPAPIARANQRSRRSDEITTRCRCGTQCRKYLRYEPLDGGVARRDRASRGGRGGGS
jgi:hypothetical protein